MVSSAFIVYILLSVDTEVLDTNTVFIIEFNCQVLSSRYAFTLESKSLRRRGECDPIIRARKEGLSVPLKPDVGTTMIPSILDRFNI